VEPSSPLRPVRLAAVFNAMPWNPPSMSYARALRPSVGDGGVANATHVRARRVQTDGCKGGEAWRYSIR
jgi:hypothetical protein